jgi:ribosome-binding factor A
MEKPVKSIKKAQRESLLLKEIAQLFLEKSFEDPELKSIFINRVELSDDGGICTIYFYSSQGKEAFEQALDKLKLYKPSLRKAIASRINTRYTPELIFRFDDQLKKQLEIEELIERVRADDARYSDK